MTTSKYYWMHVEWSIDAKGMMNRDSLTQMLLLQVVSLTLRHGRWGDSIAYRFYVHIKGIEEHTWKSYKIRYRWSRITNLRRFSFLFYGLPWNLSTSLHHVIPHEIRCVLRIAYWYDAIKHILLLSFQTLLAGRPMSFMITQKR